MCASNPSRRVPVPARRRLAAACAAGLLCAPAIAARAEPSPPPLSTEWEARLRHESVADDAFTRTADSTTLRLLGGLRLRPAPSWEALVQAEAIAGSGRYDSGRRGEAGRPPVLDPAGMEWNQAWLARRGPRFGATLGRQRLLFDNQRWLGDVGWRQNMQTFDALALDWTPRAGMSARWLWLDRVHRVAGDDARDPLARERALDSHFVNLALARGEREWVGYAYLHEDRDVAAASTATYGLRWRDAGPREDRGWHWTLEAAQQSDHADNPAAFSHPYRLAEVGYGSAGFRVRAGSERLGGDGRHSLQTPLATLHAFNGWADKFLATPPAGLQDRFLGASGRFSSGGWRACDWQLVLHDYRADAGGAAYGHEWNASLSIAPWRNFKLLAKFADYRSDGFGRDTRKWWLQVEWRP